MFILYAVVLGILAGLVVGGRPSGLAAIDIRWSPLIVGGLVAQVVLFSPWATERVGDLGPWLYVASTAVVVAAMVRNWRIPGIPITVAGALCNMAAVVANGGYMPASPAALAAAGRTVSGVYTNSSLVPDPALWFLTDIFALPTWLPASNVFSIGDVLVGVGVAAAIVIAMRRRPATSPAVADLGARDRGAPAH
jgi:hypothetical protein